MAASKEKSESFFPLAGQAEDGYSNADEATATCFCGAVQLAFPTHGEGFIDAFKCNCSDCHKITASMFASNFTIADTHLKHLRGQDNLKTYSQSKTIATGNTMTNYFCGTCGTLMYRVSSGWPDKSILRIGTIDDFSLHDSLIKPQVEQFITTRPAWVNPIEGVGQHEGESH